MDLEQLMPYILDEREIVYLTTVNEFALHH